MNGWKLILGSLVRNALQLLFATLITRHVLTQGQVDVLPVNDMVVGVVGAIVTGAWSLWQKVEAKWKFLAALSATPSTSQRQIDADSKLAPIAEKIAAIKE